jgi:hypothetical protein
MNDFEKLQILLQLTGKEKAASTVGSIENLSSLRNTLKEIPALRGNYRFGKNENVRVRHNLVDELVNKLTEKMYFNRHQDINPRVNIGTRFGSENNWQANLGLNLGQNKGIKFNIGRSF